MKRKFLATALVMTVMTFGITNVFAATSKTDALVTDLRKLASSFNGNVTYEDDELKIDWKTSTSEDNDILFDYANDVIEYSSLDINSFKDATNNVSHSIYLIYLIQTSLKLNGFTDEEIKTYLQDDTKTLDYEKNGILLEQTGEPQVFKNDDETETITSTPITCKINIKKANISEDAFEPKTTTIEDFIDYMNKDDSFSVQKYDDVIYSENSIKLKNDKLVITNRSYNYEYHEVLFNVEDDVLTYDSDEINSFEDANRNVSETMFLDAILSIALKNNGYTSDEISTFFESEDSTFDYDLNGIIFEFKGEDKKFTKDNETITATPMFVKIDFNKANLKTSYNVLDGDNQVYENDSNGLTFRIDANYELFKDNGKVFVDNKLVDKKYYSDKSGSTIITLSNEYLDNLEDGDHTFKVVFNNNKDAVSTFTIAKANEINNEANPQTGDNIIGQSVILLISVVGLSFVSLFIKKQFN